VQLIDPHLQRSFCRRPKDNLFMLPEQFEVTLAIIFADISGSTTLYEKVGNLQARAMIEDCLGILQQVIFDQGGEFVHSRGDDVLCTFENPQNAFETVKHMLAKTEAGDLSVHVGLDYGQAIRTREDVFGDCVNIAARLAGLANPNEALCSENLHSNISPAAQQELHFFDTRRLRGKSEAENIYRYADINAETGTQVAFGDNSLAALMASAKPTGKSASAKISFAGETATCTPNRDITIGRADGCDLVIPRQWVSRQHAVIEMRQDHAYLRDISANGTYVSFANQPPILLRRETMALPTQCTLSPTRHPDKDDALSIICQVIPPTL
jgi:adenylate cyclase